jgi:hypothetical protein
MAPKSQGGASLPRCRILMTGFFCLKLKNCNKFTFFRQADLVFFHAHRRNKQVAFD